MLKVASSENAFSMVSKQPEKHGDIQHCADCIMAAFKLCCLYERSEVAHTHAGLSCPTLHRHDHGSSLLILQDICGCAVPPFHQLWQDHQHTELAMLHVFNHYPGQRITCIAPYKVPFHLALSQHCTAALGLLILIFKMIVKWRVEVCTALLALWSLLAYTYCLCDKQGFNRDSQRPLWRPSTIQVICSSLHVQLHLPTRGAFPPAIPIRLRPQSN